MDHVDSPPLRLLIDDYGRASHRDCPARFLRPGRCSVNLGIKDLRVLVTAGAGGIGLEIARSFVAEGARVHVCDVDAKALRALAKSDPKITRSKARRVGPQAGREAVPRGARRAERPRRAGQQCRHRGADRQGRRDRAGGVGPLSRRRHHRPVQLHAARGAASAQKQERLDREPVVGRRPARLPAAHALFGGEMGGGRLHQVARRRARAGRHPRQRDPARHRVEANASTA